MPIVTTPAGALNYRTFGPAESTTPPVVFVHGFLVDSSCGIPSHTAWPRRGSARISWTGRSAATARRCVPTPICHRPASPRSSTPHSKRCSSPMSPWSAATPVGRCVNYC